MLINAASRHDDALQAACKASTAFASLINCFRASRAVGSFLNTILAMAQAAASEDELGAFSLTRPRFRVPGFSFAVVVFRANSVSASVRATSPACFIPLPASLHAASAAAATLSASFSDEGATTL